MCGFFIRIIVTYAYIFFSGRSKVSRGTSSQLTGMLPYRSSISAGTHSFGNMLDTRLLSTRSRSTSELLRTL